jgi:D-sedoheptulose 7-phosphate isomerase
MATSTSTIANLIAASIDVKTAVLQDEAFHARIAEAVACFVDTFKQQGKVLFCGNGGSAADAQHLAAELSGRFYRDRAPLFAEALHVNTSYLTAVANDYGYDHVFERMTEAAGRAGDVLVAISTSGNSSSIVNAAVKAKALGMTVVGMTGETGGTLAAHCDILLNVPSRDTPRIQEVHILLGHIICELTEREVFV